MQKSTNKIFTTHTGSLPRPVDLQHLLEAQDRGEQIDCVAFEARVREAVKEVVQRQASCGIDVVNDGEMSKISYSTYVKDRLTGFDDRTALSPALRLDLPEFPGFAKRVGAVLLEYARPACTGPIRYRGKADLERDIANLKAAVEGAKVTEVFMTAASPGVISLFLANQYYPTHEAYLYALADAMQEEYQAIYQAGFLLQLDCPDLAVGMSGADEANLPFLRLHLQALNHAVRAIPPDRLRLHLCWGNYEGPHHRDVPLQHIIGEVLQARPVAVSFEGANPRHEHEWKVFEQIRLPQGKVIIPGVLDSTTNFIEHPELVAQRLERYASVVGRENVIAGSDCGFATFAGLLTVDPDITWAKLASMVEGARTATDRLW
jgi:5-methyltetrahydropteroyltriglutamate--homocysteine methyltransferase